jgi:Ca2+/H+ antiporter, TMEM165/GDT1 family
LKPDKLESAEGEIRDSSVLVATFVAFFVAEMGDKTQIATLALAAAYPSLIAVIAGTTCGMLLANAPVVFLGKAFADRLPLKAIHLAAAVLFAVLGVLFIVRGVR